MADSSRSFVMYPCTIPCTTNRRLRASRLRRLTLHQYLVFLSGCVLYGMSGGLFFALGALFPVIMQTFSVTRAEAAIVHSVYAACGQGGGIVFGMITSRLGAVKTVLASSIISSLSLIAAFWATSLPFLISTSVVTACGLGMTFIASTVGVRGFFAGKSGVVALALISSSSGTTGVAFTYILRYLSDKYGLRGTLLIIGGLELNCACLGFSLRQMKNSRKTKHQHNSDFFNVDVTNISQTETDTHLRPNAFTKKDYFKGGNGNNNVGFNVEDDIRCKLSVNNTQVYNRTTICPKVNPSGRNERKDSTCNVDKAPTIKTKLKHLFCNKSYVTTTIGELMCLSSIMQYVMFLLDMYTDRKYSSLQGSIGLIVMNIAAIFGRAGPAAFAKCSFYNTFLLPVSSNIFASIAMLLLIMANNVTLYYALSACIGFALGTCLSVNNVNVSELVEIEYLGEAVGLMMSSMSVFSLMGGPFTGFLRDSTGSYTVSQILTSIFTGLGSIMFLIAAYFQKHHTKQLNDKKNNSTYYVTRL